MIRVGPYSLVARSLRIAVECVVSATRRWEEAACAAELLATPEAHLAADASCEALARALDELSREGARIDAMAPGLRTACDLAIARALAEESPWGDATPEAVRATLGGDDCDVMHEALVSARLALEVGTGEYDLRPALAVLGESGVDALYAPWEDDAVEEATP